MNTHIRTLTALFLTFGVLLAVSSGFEPSIVGLLSGQGSTLTPEHVFSAPRKAVEAPLVHGAAPLENTANRELIMGILLILLSLGIYTLWHVRERDLPPSKHTKKTTPSLRASSRWFWIG